MRSLFIIAFIFITYIPLHAQDGSDIYYYKTGGVDNKLKGKFAHIDFYNWSMYGYVTDTVTITIYTKPVLFREIRKDNGFENWFSQQYLESVDSFDHLKVRIVKCRIDLVTSDSILVTNYIEYYRNGQLIYELNMQEPYWFSKKIIAGVLVYSGQERTNR